MGINLYGGQGFAPPSSDPWDNLHEIQHQLEAGHPLRPGLARWLGSAIQAAEGDPAKLLQHLGLKRAKGRPHVYPPDMWRWWGQRVQQEIDRGEKPDKAVEIVGSQLAEVMLETPERSTIKRWHSTWCEAWDKQRKAWADLEAQLRQEALQPRDEDERGGRIAVLLEALHKELADLQRERADAKLLPEIREQVHEMDTQLETLRKKLTGCP